MLHLLEFDIIIIVHRCWFLWLKNEESWLLPCLSLKDSTQVVSNKCIGFHNYQKRMLSFISMLFFGFFQFVPILLQDNRNLGVIIFFSQVCYYAIVSHTWCLIEFAFVCRPRLMRQTCLEWRNLKMRYST